MGRHMTHLPQTTHFNLPPARLNWMKGVGVTNASVFVSQIGFPSPQDYVEQVTRRRQHYLGDFGR